MPTNDITIDLANPDDAGRILELNRAEFGGRDLLTSPGDFAWRIDGNPAGRGVIPVLRDPNGQVVGYICMIPLYIRVKGQDRKGATATNLVIDPAYRNGLTLTRLVRRLDEACREQDAAVHFSFVTEAYYRQSRRLRPGSVSTLPVLCKILKVGTLVRALLGRRRPPTSDPDADGSAAPQGSRLPFDVPPDGMEVRAVQHFDSNIDTFWETVRDDYPAIVVRDRSYLEWRFGAGSKRDYRILVAEADEGIRGYLVYRCAGYQDLRIGLIMDLLVARGEPGATAAACLLAQAERYFRGREASLIAALCSKGTREHRAMRRARFFTMPDALAPRTFRFSTVYHHGRECVAGPAVPADQWFATLSDWEAY